MTNGESAGADAMGWAAGTLEQAPAAISAKAASSLGNRRIAMRLAQQEWRFKSIPLEAAPGRK
jgi:hypothetical protein